MTKSLSTRQIESLAAEIGENIYIEIAKWRLYLAEAHLHTILAEIVAPLVAEGTLSNAAITEILRQIPVKLGDGRLEVSLVDLIPTAIQGNLVNLLQDYQENL